MGGGRTCLKWQDHAAALPALTGERGRRARAAAALARAGFELARRVQSAQGAQMGEVFAFVSGLYFRGKLTYATRFADVGDYPATTELGGGVLVITPGAGLRSADTHVNADALRLFAQIEINLANPAYRTPLEASARRVARAIGEDGECRAPGIDRVAEIRRRAAGHLRLASPVSDGVRRPRRHEPRRPAAAAGERRRASWTTSRSWAPSATGAAAEAGQGYG